MNKLILPNARFISLPSAQLGQDWFEVCLKLDSALEALNLELSEEAIYLHYSLAPALVLEGRGECRVARSVTGPLKNLDGDFKLTDWNQGFVFKFSFSLNSWESLLSQCYSSWEHLIRENHKIKSAFTVSLRRGLKDSLSNSIEVIFYQG